MACKEIVNVLEMLSSDDRLTVWHMCMYTAMLQIWFQSDCSNPFQISRSRILKLSHIGNIVTYHKCIKELVNFGYIKYFPSYHPLNGSKVFLFGISSHE